MRVFPGLQEFFRAVALVLRSDQDNMGSLLPFKHMSFCCCVSQLRQESLVLI